MNQTEFFSRKGSNNRKRRRRANRVAKLQTPITGHVYSTIPLAIPPTMPKEFSVSLIARTISSGTDQSTTAITRLGLIEFLGNRPLYLNELYAMYKYCRVTSAHYRFEIVNLGSASIQVAAGVVADSDFSTLSVSKIIEKPQSIQKIVSAKGGVDRAVMQARYNPQQWVGNPYYTKDYWINQTQSSSSTPLDADELS